MGNVDEKVCSQCTSKKAIVKGCCNLCYKRLVRQGKIHPKKRAVILDKLTFFQNNVLVGLMLGDGFISNRNTPALRVNRSIKDENYLRWQWEVFRNFCTTEPWLHTKFDKKRNKKYFGISFTTAGIPAFRKIRKQWYQGHTKVIPKDIKLNSQILAIWLCDDGCITINKKTGLLSLKFATNGFRKSDVQILCNLLLKRYTNCSFTVSKNGKGYVIRAANKATLAFINDVRSSIPKSMERKLRVCL